MTSLQQQLRALAQKTPRVSQLKRVSVLFTEAEAQTLDIQAIFNIGTNGFMELCRMDERFAPFEQTLFSPSSITYSRQMHTKDDNRKLDISIERFLVVVSPYVLLKPAHKALEYLVRRFSIQIYNVEAVLRTVLPYHDSEIFCRIARILKVDTTRWEWLEITKKHDSGVPRSLLVSETKRELSILQFLADACKRSVEARVSSSKAIICLYAAIALEVISGVKVDDRLVQLMLPSLFDGLACSASSDFQAASYMIVVQLAEFTSFTEELASALLVALCASSRRSVEDTAMVLIHFCQMQAQLKHIPVEALEHLLELPYFIETLVDLLEEFSGEHFVTLLVKGLIGHLPSDKAFCAARTLLSEHDISFLSEELLKTLIESYASDMGLKGEEVADRQSQRRTLIRILEAKHPTQLDNVLDPMLAKESSNARLLVALSSIVGSVRNQPLKSSGTTMFLSLNHSSKHIRKSALLELTEQYPSKKTDPDFISFYGSSLAAALKDEKDSIVEVALNAPNLAGAIGAEALRSRIIEVVSSGHSAGTIHKALSVFFSKELRQVEGAQGGHGLLLLLQRCTSPATWKAKSTALSQFGGAFPLTAGIKSVLKKSPAVASPADARAANQLIFQHVGSKLANPSDCETQLHNLLAAVEASSQLAEARTLIDHHALALILLCALETSKQEDDQIRLASALMDFIKPFLSSLSGHLVPEQVQRILEAPTSKRGETDLGVALRCLQGICEHLPVVEEFGAVSSATWATVSRPSVKASERSAVDQVYGLLIRAYAVLASSPSYESLGPIFKTILAGKHLAGPRVLRFLSMFWFDEAVSDAQELLRVRSLNFASAAIVSMHSEALLQQLLPSLLCGLQDRSQPVRAASLQACALARQFVPQKAAGRKKKRKSMGEDSALDIHGDPVSFSAAELQLPTATFVGLLDAILADKDTILVDCSHLSHTLMLRLLAAGKAGEELTAYLANHVQVLGHPRAKFLLLLALASLKTASAANRLANEFKRLVKAKTVLAGCDERVAVLYLRHFNQYTASGLDDAALEAFETALQAGGLLMAKATQSADADVVLADTAAQQVTGGFFGGLSSAASARVFRALVSVLRAEYSGTRATALEAFSHFELPTDMILAELDVLDADTSANGSKKRRKRNLEQAESYKSVLDRLDSVLELLSSKKIRLQRESFFHLLRPLFRLVKVLSGQTDHPAANEPTAEYSLQLVLHVLSKLVTLLLLLRSKQGHSDPDGDQAMGEVDPEVDARVEKENEVLAEFVNASVVVQCIRVSKSPQIHNKALLFLSSLASVFPEQVLENVMPVFTVMGATTMAQDDNYSFQVIQKIVQTIVPRIRHRRGNAALLPLMKIFTDALHRVPSHRRLLLFAVFMSSLSSQQYHCLMVMLLAKQTQCSETLPSGAETDVLGFCLGLCHRLPAAAVVEAFTLLITTLHKLTAEPESDDIVALLQHMPVRVRSHALLQAASLVLVERFLTSREFVAQVLRLSSKEEQSLQEHLVALFLSSMKLVQALASEQNKGAQDLEAQDSSDEELNTSFAGRIELLCNVIDATNDLMETEQFTKCITLQLSHADAQLRRRALLVLNDKIESIGKEHLEEDVQQQFVAMVRPIVDMLTAAASVGGASTLNQQTAMYSLEILARHFAAVAPQPFLDALPVLVQYLGLESASPQLLASTIICVATYCMHLGPRIMGHLPVVYPKIIELLSNTLSTTVSKKSKIVPREGNLHRLDDPASLLLLQLSCLSAVEVATKSLAQFTGPYLSALLEGLLHPELVASDKSQVRAKVAAVIQLLTEKVEARLLLPAVIASYKKAFVLGESALCALFKLLAGVCRAMPRKQISDHYTKLFKFFAFVFDFRHQALRKKRKVLSADQLSSLINVVEKKLLHAFKAFVMRLDEQLFKPLFFKILDWAYQAEPALYATRVTFLYRLIERLCSHLKGIFVPYFAYILENAVSVLQEPEGILKDTGKPSKGFAKTMPDEALLFCIQSLTRCFEHDTDQFVSKERFSTVVPPLVNVLENRSSSPRFGEIAKALVLCLGALVESLTNDKLWKPLQHLVLLKTRSEEKRTRRAALLVLREFYARQKEDFLVVLPEAIPYIAELLEDSDEEVEGLCQDTVAEIDELLGDEKIEDYL